MLLDLDPGKNAEKKEPSQGAVKKKNSLNKVCSGSVFVENYSSSCNQKQAIMKIKKTRNFLLLLATAFVFTGCMSNYPVTQDPYRIKEFPTPRHNNEIKVYFPGEKLPEKPYIQTHTFEARNFPGAPMSVQVQQIREQARDAGVDAVIVMSHRDQAELTRYGNMIMVNSLTALGIKFKENVDYLHMYRYVDQLYAFNSEKDTFELVANLYPNFDGQVKTVESLDSNDLGKFYFENYVRRYSLDFLLAEQSERWRYKTSLNGLVTRRDYVVNGAKHIMLKLHYAENSKKLERVEASMYGPGERWHDYEILLDYGPNKMISEKRILENGNLELIERFYYDDKDRLMTSTYHKVAEGAEQPFLRTHYYYYEDEDIFEQF